MGSRASSINSTSTQPHQIIRTVRRFDSSTKFVRRDRRGSSGIAGQLPISDSGRERYESQFFNILRVFSVIRGLFVESKERTIHESHEIHEVKSRLRFYSHGHTFKTKGPRPKAHH